MTADRAAFDDAVNAYWRVRDLQRNKQIESGNEDAGLRGAVTGGAHLHPLTEVVRDIFLDSGIDADAIGERTNINLPGFYRPTKDWDLVVVDEKKGLLVGAVEFKSQVGPSFGNNFNNRSEEAIGNAVDVWRAYEEGTLGSVRPWLAYCFLLEDAEGSRRPVRVGSGPFAPEPVFEGASYMDRYRILCKRLVRERLYDAALFVASTASPAPVTISEPDEELGFANLVAAIRGRCEYIKSL